MEFLKRDTRIDFIGRRRIAALISISIIVILLLSLFIRGLNLGIDFTGGTLVEVSYSSSVNAEEVRTNLRRSGLDSVVVQYFGTSRDVLIRLPADPEVDAAETSSLIMSSLRMPYGETLAQTPENDSQRCIFQDGTTGDCTVQMRRVEFVGPQVGDELTEKGGLAMLYALIGILAYVAWRFEWRFALGAVIALVHDVLVTVGFFSLLGLEFSLPVLAAVLAVIGYSLNDTIVVFDRIRENFRKMRKGTIVDIMNSAINQTLRRTLLTSLTTLLVVVTLILLGGEIIKGFAVALFIGILVGTYSSIFVASPVVLSLRITRDDMLVIKKEGEEADSLP
ncbi:MAG: protein translocase subunit SecF [Arenicellales bacterium]|nr:protein translocase subunit SecF [Arenicellales bacterium]MDP6411582.1 protein translocase subunit SecF [Arenicellales bacterium]MDP7451750.1 protein translocase subunit SecF [Arenicellales bacterium]MDP7517360.1 protein translocase subunit SecF [Arenicellales bacterium]MDP7616129.1 protein translocase subunit SecF [Arenicellales bacterium]